MLCVVTNYFRQTRGRRVEDSMFDNRNFQQSPNHLKTLASGLTDRSVYTVLTFYLLRSPGRRRRHRLRARSGARPRPQPGVSPAAGVVGSHHGPRRAEPRGGAAGRAHWLPVLEDLPVDIRGCAGGIYRYVSVAGGAYK